MADHVQPDAGEEREVSSSGLLLSVDPLQGEKDYKLSGGDSDGSDKGGLLGDDSDSDGSNLLGGDSDGSDAADADGSDAGGGDSDASDATDADGSDAGGIAADSNETGSQMNPLGIGDTNVDADSSDAGGSSGEQIRPSDAKDMRD